MTIEKSNKKYSKKIEPKRPSQFNVRSKSTYPKWQVFGQVEHGDKLGFFWSIYLLEFFSFFWYWGWQGFLKKSL